MNSVTNSKMKNIQDTILLGQEDQTPYIHHDIYTPLFIYNIYNI